MKNSRATLNLIHRDDHAPVGYKEITCYLIFNVKMDLARKSRYVEGGYITNTLSPMTYASVVSHDSVRIFFLISVLNDLYILAGDTQNAYLNALKKEKLFLALMMNGNMTKGKLLLLLDIYMV